MPRFLFTYIKVKPRLVEKGVRVYEALWCIVIYLFVCLVFMFRIMRHLTWRREQSVWINFSECFLNGKLTLAVCYKSVCSYNYGMKFGIGKMGSSEFDFNLKNVNYPSRGTTSCLLLHQKCFLGAPNSPLNFCQKFYQKRYSKCFGLLCSQF